MVKITIDDKDLEQMPSEMKETLLKFLIKSKEAAQTDDINPNILKPLNVETSEASIAKKEVEIPYNFISDTMTLEAAVALCAGLNAETSLKFLEALIDSEELSRKQIADMTGSDNEKGINGLIGSINRRFKGMIEDDYDKPNLVDYRKNSQSYFIKNGFRAPLRFGIWAVSQQIDWDSCVSIIWETESLDTFIYALNLNLDSIKGFLDKSKLGICEHYQGQKRTNDGLEIFTTNAMSNCGDEGNAFGNEWRGDFCISTRGEEVSHDTSSSKLDLIWHETDWDSSPSAESFVQSEGTNSDLGRLVAFYSLEELQDYAFQKAQNHISEFPHGKDGKVGFYWDDFIHINKNNETLKKGAFFWFDSLLEEWNFIKNIYLSSKGSIIYGNGSSSWSGQYNQLFNDPENLGEIYELYTDSAGENKKINFWYRLRDFFFSEILKENSYAGAIKEEHYELFAKAINDFKIK